MKRVLLTVTAALMVFALTLGAVTPVFAEGTAPVAENLEIRTYRNTSVGGRLSAYDPDGSIAAYEISTQPVKGQLRVSDGGLFIYTPDENRRGRDYFGYRAIDSDGNVSQEATVIIRIEKQKSGVVYPDMSGDRDGYAAAVLSERGIFTGSQLCGQYRFEPEKTVSRGEFLVMCMEVSGEPVFSSVLSTGFSDDAEMQDWLKPYVATAAMCGVDLNCSSDGDRLFCPDSAITVGEAASMLDSLLELSPAAYLTPKTDDAQALACMELSACGILDSVSESCDLLKRGEAARMLAAALELLEKR